MSWSQRRNQRLQHPCMSRWVSYDEVVVVFGVSTIIFLCFRPVIDICGRMPFLHFCLNYVLPFCLSIWCTHLLLLFNIVFSV